MQLKIPLLWMVIQVPSFLGCRGWCYHYHKKQQLLDVSFFEFLLADNTSQQHIVSVRMYQVHSICPLFCIGINFFTSLFVLPFGFFARFINLGNTYYLLRTFFKNNFSCLASIFCEYPLLFFLEYTVLRSFFLTLIRKL